MDKCFKETEYKRESLSLIRVLPRNRTFVFLINKLAIARGHFLCTLDYTDVRRFLWHISHVWKSAKTQTDSVSRMKPSNYTRNTFLNSILCFFFLSLWNLDQQQLWNHCVSQGFLRISQLVSIDTHFFYLPDDRSPTRITVYGSLPSSECVGELSNSSKPWQELGWRLCLKCRQPEDVVTYWISSQS